MGDKKDVIQECTNKKQLQPRSSVAELSGASSYLSTLRQKKVSARPSSKGTKASRGKIYEPLLSGVPPGSLLIGSIKSSMHSAERRLEQIEVNRMGSSSLGDSGVVIE